MKGWNPPIIPEVTLREDDLRLRDLYPRPTWESVLLSKPALEYTSMRAELPRFKEGAKVVPRDFAEYVERCVLYETRPVRMYHGAACIIVDENYAQRFDRIWQLIADVRCANGPEAQEARTLLDAHPLKERVMPEHVNGAIVQLPDQGLSIRQVILHAEASPFDAWFAQLYAREGLETCASTNFRGTISLFKSAWSGATANYINHEWARP